MVAEVIADLLEGTGLDPAATFAGLQAAGYMEKVRVDPTVTSSGTPLSRAMLWRWQLREADQQETADRLVQGLGERARDYTADPGQTDVHWHPSNFRQLLGHQKASSVGRNKWPFRALPLG
ncbi:hypothetical protein [Arthrobacter sp. SD76]|uniref:hypothetical protein n=1 Tax=Arthrobacter sp. SD76 TaxID=3415007 RepID=UPI003C721057